MSVNLKNNGDKFVNDDYLEEVKLGFVKCCTPTLRGKRVAIGVVKNGEGLNVKKKKEQSSEGFLDVGRTHYSLLESLPQEILIRILCGVYHEDLEQLVHVSTTIREAALIAKERHFPYKTPRKTCGFRTTICDKGSIYYDEIESPKAPKRRQFKRRGNDLAALSDLSVRLFA